jgi:transcriptional regulator with XRE-family HTH domain
LFGSRLKNLRENQGLTQNDLADYLNTARTTITLYENGTNEPDFNMLVKIADRFNVSLDYLLCRTNEEYNFNLLDNENKEILLKLYKNKEILLDLYEVIDAHAILKK